MVDVRHEARSVKPLSLFRLVAQFSDPPVLGSYGDLNFCTSLQPLRHLRHFNFCPTPLSSLPYYDGDTGEYDYEYNFRATDSIVSANPSAAEISEMLRYLPPKVGVNVQYDSASLMLHTLTSPVFDEERATMLLRFGATVDDLAGRCSTYEALLFLVQKCGVDLNHRREGLHPLRWLLSKLNADVLVDLFTGEPLLNRDTLAGDSFFLDLLSGRTRATSDLTGVIQSRVAQALFSGPWRPYLLPDPLMRFEDGCTLLHCAASAPTALSFLGLLLDAGVDPNLKNNDGLTAAEIAVSLFDFNDVEAEHLRKLIAATEIVFPSRFLPVLIRLKQKKVFKATIAVSTPEELQDIFLGFTPDELTLFTTLVLQSFSSALEVARRCGFTQSQLLPVRHMFIGVYMSKRPKAHQLAEFVRLGLPLGLRDFWQVFSYYDPSSLRDLIPAVDFASWELPEAEGLPALFERIESNFEYVCELATAVAASDMNDSLKRRILLRDENALVTAAFGISFWCERDSDPQLFLAKTKDIQVFWLQQLVAVIRKTFPEEGFESLRKKYQKFSEHASENSIVFAFLSSLQAPVAR